MDQKKHLLLQQLKTLMIFISVLFLIALGGVSYSKKTFSNVSAKKISEEDSIIAIKSDLSTLQNKMRAINDQLKLWNTINSKAKKRQGLQIDQFKTILTDLQEHYNLGNKININITSPTELNDIYRAKTTVIESSTITLTINALNDIVVLAFIDSLIKNTPGFLNYQSLVINRNLDLNNEVISDAAKGVEDTLVQATVVLIWRDFKDSI
jgi:hypothetical protein